MLDSDIWFHAEGIYARAAQKSLLLKIRQFHFILFSFAGFRNMVWRQLRCLSPSRRLGTYSPSALYGSHWLSKIRLKFENEYTKARGIFYDLSDFASGRCRKPGPEPTEPRKQKNYSEPLSELVDSIARINYNMSQLYLKQ